MRAIYTAAILLLSLKGFSKGIRLITSEPLNSTGQELAVKGRMGILIKQKLSFGDFHTVSVKRSAIQKWTGYTGMPGFIWTEHIEGKQSIKFKLTNGEDTSEAIAISRIDNTDLAFGTTNPNGPVSSIFRVGTRDQSNNYSVAIYLNKTETPWELFLDNNEAHMSRQSYTGYVRRDEVYYTIVPIWTIERKGKIFNLPFGVAGFEIRNDEDKALAAVSLIDNGVVYLGQLKEQEKLLMANVCAALFLQTNIAE
ncbi:hypothetical protein [Polluticoccus soli]|uniref:hypothetical protein n=1 Tax=Polluticoccus soli TaxID=3034150 RepID=UPI0023E2C21A|nr:hypothetical protein [Flavipsychrobacter sp. JY13-12]